MPYDLKNINTGEEEADQVVRQKEIKPDLEQYKDLEDITTKKLEFGLWFQEHRRLLYRILIFFLILIGAVSWTYTIYGFTYYLAVGMKQDEILLKQLVEIDTNHNYLVQISAQELIYYPAQILSSGRGKFDIFSLISNKNDKWRAEFDYYFLAGGSQTAKTKSYIFPGESKYLVALAQDFNTRPDKLELKIENLAWSRINQHKIPDWDSYYNSHMDIVATDIKYLGAGQSDLSQNISLNQLNFIAANKTPYNYWQVNFIILLYSGNAVTNINTYVLTDFMSGEKRPIAMSMPGNIGSVSQVKIIPEINIMDKDIYIEYEGGIGEIK